MSDFTPEEIAVLKELAQQTLRERAYDVDVRNAGREACKRGVHAWVRDDPRSLKPYCDLCGKVKP